MTTFPTRACCSTSALTQTARSRSGVSVLLEPQDARSMTQRPASKSPRGSVCQAGSLASDPLRLEVNATQLKLLLREYLHHVPPSPWDGPCPRPPSASPAEERLDLPPGPSLTASQTLCLHVSQGLPTPRDPRPDLAECLTRPQTPPPPLRLLESRAVGATGFRDSARNSDVIDQTFSESF